MTQKKNNNTDKKKQERDKLAKNLRENLIRRKKTGVKEKN